MDSGLIRNFLDAILTTNCVIQNENGQTEASFSENQLVSETSKFEIAIKCIYVVVLVATAFGMSHPVFSDTATSQSSNLEKSHYDETLQAILPGASFVDCAYSKAPQRCSHNKERLYNALDLVRKTNWIPFTRVKSFDQNEVSKLNGIEFLEISGCFEKFCNTSVDLAGGDRKFAGDTWAALSEFLYCRYHVFQALSSMPNTITDGFEYGFKAELSAREICIGAFFPEHLTHYINEQYIVRENGRF